MGRHSEWRKEVKKQRRKRIRSATAQERDAELARVESSPGHHAWREQQAAAAAALAREEEEELERRERQWLEEELRAQQEFRLRQLERARHDQEVAKQKEALLAEIAAREERRRAEEEAREAERVRLETEAREREQRINDFLQQGAELPAELRVASETNPARPPCPFFSKVAACRFGDQCSRNHVRPSISCCLLIPCMFSHPSLLGGGGDRGGGGGGDQSDWGLEFAESEVRSAFLEFYSDVQSELAGQGSLTRLLVSCNAEPHLRGSVYAQFATEREALQACRMLAGRWFAGRRLQPVFVTVPSWRAAVCGLQGKGRCPKGRNCNFLHVFHNPRGELMRSPPRPPPPRSSRRSRSRSLSPWSSRRSEGSWSVRSARRSRSPTPRTLRKSPRSHRTRSPTPRGSRAKSPTPRSCRDKSPSRTRRSRSPTPRKSNRRSPSRSLSPWDGGRLLTSAPTPTSPRGEERSRDKNSKLPLRHRSSSENSTPQSVSPANVTPPQKLSKKSKRSKKSKSKTKEKKKHKKFEDTESNTENKDSDL